VNLNLDSTLPNWGFGSPAYNGWIGLNEGGNNPLDSIANTALPNTSLVAYKSGIINFTSGLDDIDRSLTNLNRMQAVISAKQSYFQAKYDEVEQKEIDFTKLKSNYLDLDFAEESSNYAREEIKSRTATSFYAQANAQQNIVLSLLP